MRSIHVDSADVLAVPKETVVARVEIATNEVFNREEDGVCKIALPSPDISPPCLVRITNGDVNQPAVLPATANSVAVSSTLESFDNTGRKRFPHIVSVAVVVAVVVATVVVAVVFVETIERRTKKRRDLSRPRLVSTSNNNRLAPSTLSPFLSLPVNLAP